MLHAALTFLALLGQGQPGSLGASPGPGAELLRAAHTDVDPAAGSYGRACLDRTDALPLEDGPTGLTLVLVAATDTEGVCKPGMTGTRRWELELVRGDAARARSVAHARVGRSGQEGAPTARLRRLAERPLVVEVGWGASAGAGAAERRELWTVSGERLVRWLGFGVSAGAPAPGIRSDVELSASPGAGPGDGALAIEGHRAVRVDAAEGDPGAAGWSATLPGAYRVEGEALTILRAIPAAVTASSELPRTADGDHLAVRAADGQTDTAWCEGSPGAGGGQWIELQFDDPLPLTGVTLLPGDAASPERWAARARPRRIRVIAPPRAPVDLALPDAPGPVRIPLPRGGDVRAVRVKVISVWRGSRDADLCISDLFADGRP